MNIIELSKNLAEESHKTEKRRDGKPYFSHCKAVAKIVQEKLIELSDNETVSICVSIAYLHDVQESNPNFWNEKCVPVLPKEIIEAVNILTRKRGQNYFDYILSIKKGSLHARVIKLADLQHNLSDLEEGSLKDKYRFAQYILSH